MMQKTMRGYIARKQHQPRYKGIGKINAIRQNMKQMEGVANQLKSERETMLKHMKDIETQIDLAIKKIKVSFAIDAWIIDLENDFLSFRQIPRSSRVKSTLSTTRSLAK